MVAQSYQEASRFLLSQGESELARGDTRQASEKGWGAAAQMVKSIAEQRGWEHKGHAELYNVIARLVVETGDDEIRRLFQVAGSLHTNFYENWDTADNVKAALGDVRRFLNKLEPMA